MYPQLNLTEISQVLELNAQFKLLFYVLLE